MAVELTDGVNGDGLFDILGKIIHSQKTNETALLTTILTGS